MATFDEWDAAYQQVYAALPGDADIACPDCGQHTLRLVYTRDPGRDSGYGHFWCDACLIGIGLCRAIIPDGAIVQDARLPAEERLPRVPNFRLVPPT
ncbi:hypothetical protein ACQP2F_06210 [Actinoplanes sp. CA-030573]|uniref:hypothetical protein n=1 Tax=Actinoplanes sp. CA-030573 TaxID=3239898 RepID=UPI003D8C74E1